MFTVNLDFGVGSFDGNNRWLEVSVRTPPGVGNYTTLAPRHKLTATPYALQTRGIFVDAAGNVGVGTTSPQSRLEVAGTIHSTSGGIRFPDGTTQTTANSGGGGGIPSGLAVLGLSQSPPGGFTYTGESISTARWRTRASSPTTILGPSDGATAVAVGGRIYVMGGQRNAGGSTRNESYDPLTDTWSIHSPIPSARGGHSAVAANGRIYLFGGVNIASALADVWEYDLGSDNWTQKASMSQARVGTVAMNIAGKIFVAGGTADGATPLALNEEFNPNGNNWVQRAGMPTARVFATAAVINDRAFVVGGLMAPPQFTAVNEEYIPASDSWQTREPSPGPLYYTPCVAYDGRLLIPGTYGNLNYAPDLDAWSLDDPLFGLVIGPGASAAVSDNRIFVFHGPYPQEYVVGARYYIHLKD